MNFPKILASLTTNPARRFKYSDHNGRIAPGMDADLVLLQADPAKDVTNLSKAQPRDCETQPQRSPLWAQARQTAARLNLARGRECARRVRRLRPQAQRWRQ